MKFSDYYSNGSTDRAADPAVKRNELAPELRRIDDALAELARREPTPEGLSERVYAASVVQLPRGLRLRDRAVTTSNRPLRFHRPVWGQFAMAASLGLSFVVVAWFLGVGAQLDHGPNTAMIAALDHADGAVVQATLTHRPKALSRDAEWMLLEATNGGWLGSELEALNVRLSDLHRDRALYDEEFGI